MITPRLPGYMSPVRVRPAGQSWLDATVVVPGTVPSNTGSSTVGGGTDVTLGKPVVDIANPAATSNADLYNTVGGAIGTTGTSIAAIIESNNQTQIAQLQSATQLQLAQLQAQARTLAATDPLAAARAASQAAALQQFQIQLAARRNSTQTMYLVAGVAAAGILGVVMLMSRSRGRRSSSMRSTRAYRSR